ncbi:class I SAM-dependent methyltransferase [Stappia sp. F7233]|uniref:Class I SAM-dependent methyltransferase n=1 Tax=Stappia albiluteola TaxID=2758565 RepID=A0A839ACL3_9HYPH|nr:class I SAM-dependent methyltransferase [Stappia albiluteola]MBA5776768.1 class I SAM-dependent methyltransferase [Stappia albiluteola]
MRSDILARYAVSAGDLITRFEAITSEHHLSPVSDLLPVKSARIVDIGAGTGRDAAWLTGKGHHVTAVEPVDELRKAGMQLHPEEAISWINDCLPELVTLRRQQPFDLVLLSAVWHHLQNSERQAALRNLKNIAVQGGLLIISLRHGGKEHEGFVFPVSTDETIAMAERESFELLRQRQTGPMQERSRAAGVHWTWLVFRSV